VEWNGITNVLTFEAPVMAGINTFALAIADTQDQRFDSAVFFSGLRQSQSTNGGGGGIIDPPVNAVPLPATAWLLISGVAALTAMRRRRQS
jgi:hypothetical protein